MALQLLAYEPCIAHVELRRQGVTFPEKILQDTRVLSAGCIRPSFPARRNRGTALGGEQRGTAGCNVDASRLDRVRRRRQRGGRGDLLGQTVLVTVTHVLKRVWLMRHPKGRFASQAQGEVRAVG